MDKGFNGGKESSRHVGLWIFAKLCVWIWGQMCNPEFVVSRLKEGENGAEKSGLD